MKKHLHHQQGFTLIELLVVIAIIGILSAVVLASLTTVRSRGNDSAIQTNMSTIRIQAEVYYGGTGGNSYGSATVTTCPTTVVTANGTSVFTDPTITRAIIATDKTNGTDSTYGTVVCNSTPTAYAVQSGLQSGIGTDRYWCIDSAGNAISKSSALG